jgi:hypothetical protein
MESISPAQDDKSRMETRMRMMNTSEAQVQSDLSVLKTPMTGLVGDGNTGRIGELERRIERHEVNQQRAKGFCGSDECFVCGGGVSEAVKTG